MGSHRVRPGLLFVLAALAMPAFGRSYCCTGDSGQRICGDVLPPQCLHRAYQEYNSQGILAKEFEAPLTADQRAQRNAELARRKAEERRAADEQRRDRALLASYSNANDIDTKRDRLLAEANAGLKQAQERHAAAIARRQSLMTEAEFYQKKPMPPALKAQIRDNQAELTALEASTEEKKRDIEALTARFAEEKERYLRLGGKTGTPPAAPPSATPGSR